MTHSPHSAARASSLLAGGLLLACAAAVFGAPGVRPLTIQFDGTAPNVVATYGPSGWPLELVMQVREPFPGFENANRTFFPAQGGNPPLTPLTPITASRIAFFDPDGCQSLGVNLSPPCPGIGQPRPPVDELNVAFSPGLVAPADFFSGSGLTEDIGPTLPGLTFLLGGGRTPFLGPYLGSTDDRYGYGASARMPGLVLISNTGVGIVSDSNFDRPAVRQCRNLAGFVSSVSVKLNNGTDRSTLHAHLNVPSELFSPLILRDDDVTVGPSCPVDTALVRVESEPARCLTNPQIAAALRRRVNVKAFVVSLDDIGNITPPEQITDLNGNGFCDASDLRMAGYRVISNTARHSFRQLHQNEVWDVGYEYPYDLDGNGSATNGIEVRLAQITPSASGGRIRAPR